MEQLFYLIHAITAFVLIGLVLLQQGKGAEMGAAFGGGASQTLFGSQGSGNFLTRMTGILAAIFFIANLALGYFATQKLPTRLPVENATIGAPVMPGDEAIESNKS